MPAMTIIALVTKDNTVYSLRKFYANMRIRKTEMIMRRKCLVVLY